MLEAGKISSGSISADEVSLMFILLSITGVEFYQHGLCL